MITLFKLLVTPLFIGSATLAGRRWGPVVNGLVVGLPLTTGPISFIIAYQYGPEFATRAAAGNMAGQISMVAFCWVYSLLAPRASWRVATPLAILVFLVSTALLNMVAWQLWPAYLLLLAAIVVAARMMPDQPQTVSMVKPPNWDLPARIIVATGFVYILTTVAERLGPQLSGLISTFPLFGVVFAAFTHSQQGSMATTSLLRGILFGSVSYAFFFLTVGLCLIPFGLAVTYVLSLLAALIVSSIFYMVTRNRSRKAMTVD